VSTWVGDQVQPLLTKVNEWGSQFIAWVPTAVTDLQTALPGIWTAVSTWIGDQVATITTKLGDWAGAFIDWIGPAIPGFLEAVGAFATGIGTAITTGVPIIVEKAQLWATELVAWIQRDALPKLQPAFDGFLAALSAQADRAKTVLATKGTEAGTSFSDGLKAGMAAAPIVVAGVMDATANAISAKGPAINAVALAVGKVAVDSMVNFMLSETPGRIAAWGAAAAQAILNIGPNLIAAGLVVGNNAATALYTAVTNTLNSYRGPLLALGAFTASTKTIVTSLGTVAQTFKTKWLEQAGVFMDAAGKGLGIISNGVDGLNKLRTFRAPSIASVNAFTDSVLVIVQSLGTAAQIFKDEWLTHAQTFFDTAGKGLGIIGAGVDGLTKLRTFHAPSIASINAFTDTVMVIVQSLGTAAQIFKDAWLAKASAFEDTAGKGLAIIGAGVDGLTKLAAFKAPSIAAINAFTDTVTLLVQSLGTVAQTFKDVWLAKAGVFADAAAKGIGIIGAGVEGFTKLSTYRGIAPAALRLFAADLQMVMDTMIGIAQDLGTKGPAAAAVFGDAVGKTIAPIGAAIDTFTKLKDYKGVARDAVILIGNDMVGVIATLGIIAQSAQGAGVAAAVAFADSAGVIFGALKTAIDALNSLAGLSKDGKAISAGWACLRRA
jgi:hypothetical protein